MIESNDNSVSDGIISAPLQGFIMESSVLDGIELPQGDRESVQLAVGRIEAVIKELKIVYHHWPFKGCGVPGGTLDSVENDLLLIAASMGKREKCEAILRGEE